MGTVLNASLSPALTGAYCGGAQKWGFVTKLPGLNTLLLATLGFFPTKDYGILACLAWPGKMPSDCGISVCLAGL